MSVQDGNLVSIEYSLHLQDGGLVESNVGKEPLQYVHGSHEIIPGLEEALGGLGVGETRHVTVPPERAYGLIDPDAFEEVEKQHVPQGAWQAGTVLVARDEAGHERQIRVHEVREQTVVVDFNHPLAGRTLVFEVKVLAVE